jgi:hypothetical protein
MILSKFSIGERVKVIKPVFEGQDPKFSRVEQKGEVIGYSGHGMPCVHFDDLPEGVGIFMNEFQLEKQ